MPSFDDIKARVSLKDAISLLSLTMKEKPQGQFRGPCPACASGGDRALAVNVSRGFYCFSAKTGGDVLALVSHVRGCDVKQAAEWLSGGQEKPKPTFKTLDLDPEHESVAILGIDPSIAKRGGLGFCKTGVLKGTIAVPVYDRQTGELLGYLGGTDFIVPPSLRGDNVVELSA